MSLPAATPGKALQCYECTAITRLEGAETFDECPHCGADETVAVDLVACELGEACRDETHHWGLGMHVIEPG